MSALSSGDSDNEEVAGQRAVVAQTNKLPQSLSNAAAVGLLHTTSNLTTTQQTTIITSRKPVSAEGQLSSGSSKSPEAESTAGHPRTEEETIENCPHQERKNVTQSSNPGLYDNSAAQAPSHSSTSLPKKRGRPPSLPLQQPDSSVIAAAGVSPRRQSLRLQRTHAQSEAAAMSDGSKRKMSGRTCQYCGVVKPTPAALQRHLRKHTGERPFICQVRSLIGMR